jgi:uncharacterized protein (TIGR02217 family)
MAFLPIQIVACPGFGFTGGPEFSTDIKNLQSGREKRNADWAVCRHKYTSPFMNISDEAYLNVKEVFLVCRGRLHSFLHKDWADYRAVDEEFGVGDGVNLGFQLRKTSTLGSGSYDRSITKPGDDVTVTINGVPYPDINVDPETGIVGFIGAPPVDSVLRWSGTFFVQVRFDNDYLPFSLDNYRGDGFANNGSVDLIEVLDE